MIKDRGSRTMARTNCTRSLRRFLKIGAFGAAMSVACPAAAQPGFCSEPDLALPAKQASLASDDLVGTYRCADEGMTITLRLDADGRFEQRLEGLQRSLDTAMQGGFDETRRVGRWRVEGNTLHMFEWPRRAPEIKLVESTRDASVRMRVEVREPDGRGASGVIIGGPPNAARQAQLNRGVLEIPLSYSWAPGVRQIVRQGDGRQLTSFEVKGDGPNVFRFVYHPSEFEPFETRAYVIDAKGQAIGIPLGLSGAILRRVPSPN